MLFLTARYGKRGTYSANEELLVVWKAIIASTQKSEARREVIA